MATGIRIVGNSGSILIDDTYRNMAVVGQGNQANTAPSPGQIYRAIQADDFYTSLALAGYSVPTHRWWDFGYPPSTTTTGLKIFNAAKQCCFNSSFKYARVVDVFDFNQASSLTKNYPAGRSYAVLQAKGGLMCDQITRKDPYSGSGWYNYARRFLPQMCKVVGSAVTVKWYDAPWEEPILWSEPVRTAPAPWLDDPIGKYIVLDVTGY